MPTRIERFRSAVARSFGGRPSRGVRYREDLKQEAMALARAGLLEGKSLGRVAEELGIGPATLTRWLERGGAGQLVGSVWRDQVGVGDFNLTIVQPGLATSGDNPNISR